MVPWNGMESQNVISKGGIQMRFSERVKAMQSSPVRRLLPYAEEARAKGKKIYPLNIGQPDIKTPPSFLQAIRGFATDVIAYATSQGDNTLGDAMSSYYHNSISLWEGGYHRHAGGSEALLFALWLMCDPCDGPSRNPSTPIITLEGA